MPKVVAPLLSGEASGSIGRALTYTRRHDGQAVKHYAPPGYRRTTAQDARRRSFDGARQVWRNAAASFRAGWDEQAAGTSLTGYNLWLSHALAPGRCYGPIRVGWSIIGSHASVP